jgi:hypothetical protein
MAEIKEKERRVDVSMDLSRSRPGVEEGLLVLLEGKSRVDQQKEPTCNQLIGTAEGTTNKHKGVARPRDQPIPLPVKLGEKSVSPHIRGLFIRLYEDFLH